MDSTQKRIWSNPRSARENLEEVLKDHVALGTVLPRRWMHGPAIYDYNGWKWSDDSRTFIRFDYGRIPWSHCLGDRMIHADFGLDSYGLIWRGSSSDHWHGWDFGYDLKKAIEWVHGAGFQELGPYLWTSPSFD